MLMGMVATQRIREEYDEDDDSQEEDEEEHGYAGMNMVGETPINHEGPGMNSTTIQNNGANG